MKCSYLKRFFFCPQTRARRFEKDLQLQIGVINYTNTQLNLLKNTFKVDQLNKLSSTFEVVICLKK